MPGPRPSSRGGETLFMRVGRVFKERNYAAEFLDNLRRKEPPALSIKTLANLDKNTNIKYPTLGNEEILEALKRKRNWFEIIIELLSIPGSEKDLIDELIGIKDAFDADNKENGNNPLPSTSSAVPPESSNTFQQEGSRKRKDPQGPKPPKTPKKIKVHACDHCLSVVEALDVPVQPKDLGRCITMWSSFRTKVLNLTNLKKREKDFCKSPCTTERAKYRLACKVYEDWLATSRGLTKAQATPWCVREEIGKMFDCSKTKKKTYGKKTF
ncbi:unnamed protein product [Lymnaea stagnalis]|uniref:Uncharacterized protein n=1 Tax=Lymnaea stagnalis TaxID=6523 RepID=A0AAV2HEK4_LYMST